MLGAALVGWVTVFGLNAPRHVSINSTTETLSRNKLPASGPDPGVKQQTAQEPLPDSEEGRGASDVQILIQPSGAQATSLHEVTMTQERNPVTDKTPGQADALPRALQRMSVGESGDPTDKREVADRGSASDASSRVDAPASVARQAGRLRAETLYRVLMVARSTDGREYRAEGRNPTLALPPGAYAILAPRAGSVRVHGGQHHRVGRRRNTPSGAASCG